MPSTRIASPPSMTDGTISASAAFSTQMLPVALSTARAMRARSRVRGWSRSIRPSSASSKTTMSRPTSSSALSLARISGLLRSSIRLIVLMESNTTTKGLVRNGPGVASGATAAGAASVRPRSRRMSSAEARSILLPSSKTSKSDVARSVTKRPSRSKAITSTRTRRTVTSCFWSGGFGAVWAATMKDRASSPAPNDQTPLPGFRWSGMGITSSIRTPIRRRRFPERPGLGGILASAGEGCQGRTPGRIDRTARFP